MSSVLKGRWEIFGVSVVPSGQMFRPGVTRHSVSGYFPLSLRDTGLFASGKRLWNGGNRWSWVNLQEMSHAAVAEPLEGLSMDMMGLFLNLLPLVIGAAIGGPMWIIVALLLLRSEHGLFKAAAFAAGATTVRLLQFAFFNHIFRAVLDSGGESEMDLMTAILLLLAGVVLLITAVRTWCKDSDPDAPPPKWMAALDRISAPVAFGMAVVMMFLAFKQWVFTLSAIAVIDEAKMGKISNIVTFLLFIAAAQALMLAPIIASALAPAQSSKLVEATLGWLERNSRAITIVVSFIFALWFLSKSASELLGHHGEALSALTL